MRPWCVAAVFVLACSSRPASNEALSPTPRRPHPEAVATSPASGDPTAAPAERPAPEVSTVVDSVSDSQPATAAVQPAFRIIFPPERDDTRIGSRLTKTSREGNAFEILAFHRCHSSRHLTSLTVFGASSKMCGYAEIRVDGATVLFGDQEGNMFGPRCHRPCRDVTISVTQEKLGDLARVETIELVACLDTMVLTRDEVSLLYDPAACLPDP